VNAETGAECLNLERWSIFGSALKRKAALQVKLKKSAAVVRKTLEASRDAYAKCEGRLEDAAINPYAMINRLQFDALLGEEDRAGRIKLTQHCKSAAEKRFVGSYNFFDAVMAIDAQVAERLLNGTLDSATNELVEGFKEAFFKVPGSERMRNSVIKQLQLMGDFFDVLAGGTEASEQQEAMRSTAENLKDIATNLDASLSSGEPGEAKEASAKPGIEGTSTTRGRKERAAKEAQKPSSKPKAPRSAKGVKKKGKRKKI
jgi:hypothetical protein